MVILVLPVPIFSQLSGSAGNYWLLETVQSKPSKHRNEHPIISEFGSALSSCVAAMRAGEKTGAGQSEFYGPRVADFPRALFAMSQCE